MSDSIQMNDCSTTNNTLSTVAIENYLNTIDPQIVQLLKQSNAKLSGSIVLYYIMNELNLNPNFEPNDIDIFVNDKCGMNAFIDWFQNNPLIIKQNTKKRTLSNNYNYLFGANLISTVLKGTWNGKVKIDIIVLNKDIDPSTFISNHFDLDIIKNSYDGNQFHIKHIDSIMNRGYELKQIYSIRTLRYMSDDSIHHYKNAIMNNKHHHDPMCIISRLNKYRQRGFTFTFADDFHIEPYCTIMDIPYPQIPQLMTVGEDELNRYYCLTNAIVQNMSRKGLIYYLEFANPVINQFKRIRFTKDTKFTNTSHADFLKYSHVGMSYDIIFKIQKSYSSVYYLEAHHIKAIPLEWECVMDVGGIQYYQKKLIM
jgi:hypothetical protein